MLPALLSLITGDKEEGDWEEARRGGGGGLFNWTKIEDGKGDVGELRLRARTLDRSATSLFQ